MKIKSGLAFHCHHDQLYEFVYDYDERVRFIIANKPEEEQELRLRLLKMIPPELVPGKDTEEYQACNRAWGAYDKVMIAYDKVMIAYSKEEEAYSKVWEAYRKTEEAYFKKWGAKIISLHKELCPECPWDGETIFPELD